MSLPHGGPSTEGLDSALREMTTRSLERWRQQLAAPRSAATLALIAREAEGLRAVALERGAPALAERLQTVARLTTAAPNALGDALRRVAECIDPHAAQAPAVTLGGTVVMEHGPGAAASLPGAAASPQPTAASPVAAPAAPVAASPASAASPFPSMLMPPPMLGASIIAAAGPSSVSEPSIIAPVVASGPAPTSPQEHPLQSTMVSSGIQAPDSPPRAAVVAHAPPPPAPAAPPMPSVVVAPVSPPRPRTPALPEPVAASVGRPKLLEGTFFGFRAFGRGRAEAPGAQAPEPPGGLLGLSKPSAAPIPAPMLPRPAAAHPGAAHHAAPRREGASRETARRAKTPRPGQQAPVSVPRWFYFVGTGIVLLAVATGIVIWLSARGADATTKRAAKKGVPGAAAASPSPSATDSTAAGAPSVAAVTAMLHEHGAETPQLRALLDMQGKLALDCRNDPSSCGRGWTPLARDALSPIDKSSLVLTPAQNGPLPGWLHNLKLPSDFPVHDEPALKNFFDYNTKNIAGRQGFQAKLFQCSAYSDIFESTFVKYGAPKWLEAVVYQESGCNPLATSPVGARGLWQFMPESARAYGLRVVDGEIDERLNPVKATDAAVHFLTDMQRKLGAWDLVLAAYNAGPFAILVRLAQVGENVGFWELEHAGLLPDETAGYVPSIEAYAIILQNLSRLQFNPYGKRLESTAEVIVKPGTRLSLLARAASTTTAHIRDLNPEFLRDVVPDGTTTARVPDGEVHRAQAFLDSPPSDNKDTCVPPDFDWGAQQFETSKYAKDCPSSAEH